MFFLQLGGRNGSIRALRLCSMTRLHLQRAFAMKRFRAASCVLGLSAVSIVLLFGLWPRQGAGHEDDADVKPGAAIELPERPIELIIELGIEDEQQVVWEGELKLSEGRVLSLELVQASNNSTVDGAKFKVRTKRQPGARPAQANQRPNQRRRAANRRRQNNAAKPNEKPAADAPPKTAAAPPNKDAAQKPDQKPAPKPGQQPAAQAQPFHLVPARIRATLDAPETARAEVVTSHGSFSFKLEEVASNEKKTFLDGQASVTGEIAAVRLTGPKTEDDFPVMAKAHDGTVWMAYVAYTPGEPLAMDRVARGAFEALEPRGNGDRIRLMRFDGQSWHAPIDATEGGLDLWRPTIAVDHQGVVWLAWGQSVEGNWEIFSRRYTPPKAGAAEGKWSKTVRVTNAAGNDFGV